MHPGFPPFGKTVTKGNERSRYYEVPDTPWMIGDMKIPEEVFREAAGHYQPTPEKEVKAALADVGPRLAEHFCDDPEAVFPCHHFFFSFHNYAYFYMSIGKKYKYIANIK
jgi:hypothetical protein